ncbi:MAG: non-homologous end-joining DNA ligase [Candidatus Eremiobacteraeota bacterium]|nr:non-homologous end-joining DNA ligase [Candidatus Eremiobacteraeota bacterium]
MPGSSSKKPRASREPGSLERYHAKRDFQATPEPKGARLKRGARLRFVVQKHRATRLHYDFRLEADGVLKSWAVPKGPSFDPGDKRLAMHVEDHPLDYRTFEGIIPKGNYGAGEVIVWDEGTYTLAEGNDATEEIGKGKIKFVLRGKKLNGEFTLVRIKGRSNDSGDPWLLIKDHDEFVDLKYDIEKDERSAKTGKTLKEIAKDPRAPHWDSSRKVETKEATKRATLRGAKHDKLPSVKSPMLATLVDEPFDDDAWVYEIKWDGYRALCTVDEKGRVRLVSRNGLDFLPQFPEFAELSRAFATLPVIVDGEIVSLDDAGRSSFQRLQGSFNRNRPSGRSKDVEHYPLTFVAFDALYADGKDLRKLPLEERKSLLERIIIDKDLVMYSKHVRGAGRALFEQAQKNNLEGIIAKKSDSTYQERRTRDWLKIKAQLMAECVVGGYTEPRGSRKGFGALLVGLYEGKTLHYVGHVGTGFDGKLLASLTARLQKLERKTTPFSEVVDSNTKAHWVKPELVAQIRFAEWTRDGLMRQPAFLGLRIDKKPLECKRERALDTDEIA